MSNILYISGNHPLSRFHVFDRPIKFADVAKGIPSLEAGFWFAMATQNQKYSGNCPVSDAGDLLLLNKVLRREPAKIRTFMAHRTDFRLSADWLLRTYDVWRDIPLYQFQEQTSFSEIFYETLGEFDNPGATEILYCEANRSESANIYSTGCKESLCEQLRRKGLPFVGLNLWGLLLQDVAKVVYGNGNRTPRFGVFDLVKSVIPLQPSHPGSMLIIGDSQMRPISDVHLGDCHAISGGTFRDIVDFILANRIRLNDYHIVVFYAGINDCQKGKRFEQESLECLSTLLLEGSRDYLRHGSVIVCPAFHIPSVPQSDGYAGRVDATFKGTDVMVIDWLKNPFTDESGNLNSSWFEADQFHLNAFGIRCVFKEWIKVLPAIRQISYSLNPRPIIPPCRSVITVNPGSRKRRIID